MDEAKEKYLKGYEAGLKEAFNEALRLIARGYKSREVQIIVKGKLGTLYQRIEDKREELEESGPFSSSVSSESLYLRGLGVPTAVKKPGQRPAPQKPAEPEKLKKGSYIVNETRSEKSFEMFSKLRGEGIDGLAIVRTYPETLRSKYKLGDLKMIWLTKSHVGGLGPGLPPSTLGLMGESSEERQEHEEVPPAALTTLTTRVAEFLRVEGEKAIILEGLEYLITENKFDTVLRFVAFLKDAVAKRGSYLIMPFDSSTRDTREYSQLRREVDFEM